MGVKTGLHELADRIAGADMRGMMQAAGERAAQRMLDIAVPLTPEAGGALRESWHAEAPVQSGRGVSMEIRNDAAYASFVEEGHRQNPERFVPAIGRRLVEDFVPGRFFLREAEAQYRAGRDEGLEKMIDERLRQVLRDDQ